MNNKEMFDNLYRKDSELAEKLRPLKFRAENNPSDKILQREINKLIKEREALKVVMNLYK